MYWSNFRSLALLWLIVFYWLLYRVFTFLLALVRFFLLLDQILYELWLYIFQVNYFLRLVCTRFSFFSQFLLNFRLFYRSLSWLLDFCLLRNFWFFYVMAKRTVRFIASSLRVIEACRRLWIRNYRLLKDLAN